MVSSFFQKKITIFWCIFIVYTLINGIIQCISSIIVIIIFYCFSHRRSVVPIQRLICVLSIKLSKKLTVNSFLRNTISKLYNAVSAPVAATRDALAERLQGTRDTTSLLYNRMMENMGYGQQERLKDIVEKEAEEEEKQQEPAADKEEEDQQQGPAAAKEQQQDDDDERYDTVAKIKLAYEGRRVKGFRVTGNLNNPNTKMIMANITPHIEMRVKVIYSFKSEVHRGVGDIVPYSKRLKFTTRHVYKFGGDSNIH